MKTVLQLILTSILSTGAFMGALTMKNPFPCFLIAFGAWAIFIWGCARRSRKATQKRYRERLFEDYMRSKTRNDQGC